MSKTFWGLVMFLSLVITAWSGFFVYNELQPKEPVAVPLRPVEPPPNPAPPTSPVAPENPNAENPQEPDVALERNTGDPVDGKEKESEADKSNVTSKKPAIEINKPDAKGLYQVHLTFTSSSAKKIYVVGDFNKWFRQPMRREGNDWKIMLKLKTGSYNYVFVVDDGQQAGSNGKRVRDPNNKQTSKDGKLSVLAVKASSNN